MAFWIFMTICNLIVPLLMITVGRMMMKNPPKTINMVFGYRTSRSMKNQQTWDFAQVYCGKLWWKIGWIMLPFSILGMLPAIGKNDDFVGGWGAVIMVVQILVLFFSIFIEERELAKKFDKEGNQLSSNSHSQRFL